MSRLRRFRPMLKKGFTLIELMVVIVFVAVAITGVMGGIRALSKADAKAQKLDLLQRLAQQKLNEFTSVTDPNNSDTSGDFSEQGHSEITWQVTVETSEYENVETITVEALEAENSQSLTALRFTRPVSTSTNGATGGATP